MHKDYTKMLKFNDGISAEVINSAEKKLKIVFPKEYRDFMLKYNGCEGEIGEAFYISLWKMEDLAELNESYSVKEFTPAKDFQIAQDDMDEDFIEVHWKREKLSPAERKKILPLGNGRHKSWGCFTRLG